MSLLSEITNGFREIHKEEQERAPARKAAAKKYGENFVNGLFGQAPTAESAEVGFLAGDDLVALIEANRGRPSGSALVDASGNPIDGRVIAQPFEAGAITAISREPKILRIHVYRLDIQTEIVTTINYDNFTNALFSLRDPVAHTG